MNQHEAIQTVAAVQEHLDVMRAHLCKAYHVDGWKSFMRNRLPSDQATAFGATFRALEDALDEARALVEEIKPVARPERPMTCQDCGVCPDCDPFAYDENGVLYAPTSAHREAGMSVGSHAPIR